MSSSVLSREASSSSFFQALRWLPQAQIRVPEYVLRFQMLWFLTQQLLHSSAPKEVVRSEIVAADSSSAASVLARILASSFSLNRSSTAFADLALLILLYP
jgi:hypothetical protein